MGVTEYTQQSMADLKKLAKEREVKVKGTGVKGALRRIDYVDALVKNDRKVEREAAKAAEHAGYNRKSVSAEDMNGAGDPHTPVAEITFPTGYTQLEPIEAQIDYVDGMSEPLNRIATALEALAFPQHEDDLHAEIEQLRGQLASAQAENRRLRTSVGEDTRDLP